MASFLQLHLRAEHWRILDAIAASPNGETRQDKIQEHFGEQPIMQWLEQLFEAGYIENKLVPSRPGQAPRRVPHVHRLTVAGRQHYDGYRKNAPAETDQPFSSTPPEPPTRGRPQGARNRPKVDAEQD